jgi:hypothetical protein
MSATTTIERLQIESNTPEWFAARLGKFTASNAYLLMQTGRSKEHPFSQSALGYIMQNVAEIISDVPPMEVSAPALSWGRGFESEARELMGFPVQTGFCYALEDYVFGTPDGETDTHIVEIKCPYNSVGHLQNLLIPSPLELSQERPEYYWQMQMNMHLAGKEMAWFASYDPRMKANSKLKIMEVPINHAHVGDLLERLGLANAMKQQYLIRIAAACAKIRVE